ncbi:class II histone deacetylase [Bradyrhizobium septentrionale]|uniref:Class II histone deacetylase n=1 Tax=Bradyrhizobium septentrionale TaxID=1404411 RepID=A0A973W2R3_9BRAD|nr:class II histone deacetylase [Bradyrhizobium septentrionale]UGY14841.1 class II histone deacetylase [Bradyrhizobium septentrionale]UGY23413.1 class II histone deacetylase [Bradyrhizobium septentrionale]
MATGFVCHELYMWHNTGNWAQVFPPGLTIQPGTHAENPETKRRFRNLVEVSGLLDHLVQIKPRAATVAELARVHTADHIAHIKRLSDAGGGDASHLTPLGAGSYEIALLAAGGAITAADAVASGAVETAYALIRPPGHHARPELGMGFCLFANASIAIRHLQATGQVSRVAVVDWDVHHGNGTQAVFYEDPSVLTISLHQDNLFPANSGSLAENGDGAGDGYNINVPLPPGSGIGAYRSAFERVVLPALHRFVPDMIVVASGFDASGVDPLGRMMLSSAAYREMTRMLRAAAKTLCNGRILMTHEGGYSEMYAPYCGLAVLEELSGIKTDIADPWEPLMAAWGGNELQPHQAAVIDAAAALVGRLPAVR